MAVHIVQQGQAEQAVESVHADFAIGPGVQRLPIQPVTFLEAPKNSFNLLLPSIGGHHMLGRPIEVVGDEQRAPKRWVTSSCTAA